MIDEEVRQIIAPELIAGERLIWAGRPQKIPIFAYSLFDFMQVFSGTIIFTQLFFDAISPNPTWPVGERETVSAVLVPAMFLAFSILLLFNATRTFLMPMKQVYGLTQTRGIIVTPIRKKHVYSLKQTELAGRARTGVDEFGTLTFRVKRRSGDIFPGLPDYGSDISFYNIENPKDVERLIQTEILKDTAT